MTKYTKYLTMMLLGALALTSCDSFNKGTVGDTTVYFSHEVVEDGFSAGFVYVPIRMDMGNEANTADVNVTVEVLDVQNAVEDTDFMVTSKELVFRPGVDSVSLEIRVIPNVDEFDLQLGLASANTDIDAQKKVCNVHIEKNTRDRLCDTWNVNFSLPIANYGDLNNTIGITTSWSIANGCIEAWVSKGVTDPTASYNDMPFYLNFIKAGDKEILTIPTYKPISAAIEVSAFFETEEAYKAFAEQYGVQPDWKIYLYQMVVVPNNSASTPFLIPTEDELELAFDVTSATKTIKFKDQSKKYAIGHSYEMLDGTGNRMMSIGWASSPIGLTSMTCK